MDTSRLPKIQDEEQESQFGYVHGVSGPGGVYLHYFLFISILIVCRSQLNVQQVCKVYPVLY